MTFRKINIAKEMLCVLNVLHFQGEKMSPSEIVCYIDAWTSLS